MEKEKNNKGLIAFLVILVVILASLCVLFATGTIKLNTKTEPDKQEEKKEEINQNDNSNKKKKVDKTKIIALFRNQIAYYMDDETHQYGIEDLNNDGVPELLIYMTGTIGNEIVGQFVAWTLEDDNFVFMGIVPGRFDVNAAIYKMNDGRLLAVRGHMGVEDTTYYKIENNWIIRTEYSSRETTDYIKGDKLIKFTFCNDTSLIDNYDFSESL